MKNYGKIFIVFKILKFYMYQQKKNFTAIVSISSLFFILTIVSIYGAIEIGDTTCSNSGKLFLDIITDQDIKTSDLEVVAKVNNIKESEYVVKGFWQDEEISDEGRFVSNNGEFLRQGIHIVNLYYKGDPVANKGINCPGVITDCEYIDMIVDDCYTRNGFFTAKFNSTGLRQRTFLDMEADIEYQFVSDDRIWFYGVIPDDINIRYDGDGYYTLRFETNTPVREIFFRIPLCDNQDYDYTTGYEKCREIVPTTTTTTTSTTTIPSTTTNPSTTTEVQPSSTTTLEPTTTTQSTVESLAQEFEELNLTSDEPRKINFNLIYLIGFLVLLGIVGSVIYQSVKKKTEFDR
jgi:hypothetical protein